jgi:hypothetical protein
MLACMCLQDVIKSDPSLAGHADHLRYRWNTYSALKKAIEQNEGGLAKFAQVRAVCMSDAHSGRPASRAQVHFAEC